MQWKIYLEPGAYFYYSIYKLCKFYNKQQSQLVEMLVCVENIPEFKIGKSKFTKFAKGHQP